MATFNVTLNGVSDISAFGDTWEWDDRNLAAFDPYTGGSSSTSHVLHMTLSGTDWLVGMVRITGQTGLTTTITDTTPDGNHWIDFLSLGEGDATVTLNNTEVRYLESVRDTANVTLTTGQTGLQSALLANGNNTVNVGSGYVGQLTFGEGNDRLNIGSNEVKYANVGGGRNTVTIGDGGQLQALTGYGEDTGTNAVTMAGDSRILTIKLDSAVNNLTTAAGNVESYYAYDSANTLDIGTGGIQQIVLSGDRGPQVVESKGWVGSLQVWQSKATVTLGEGGAGAIHTSAGADTIRTGSGEVISIFTGDLGDRVTIGAGGARSVHTEGGRDTVTTGAGAVGLINTGEGNDTVTIGRGGASFVRLEGGADLVRVRAFEDPGKGVIIQGQAGTDTLDLGLMGAGVTVSLASDDWQDVANGRGFLNLNLVENLVGGAFADRLTGEAGANRLEGRGGADDLRGGGGNDTLMGGLGADDLTGGGGADRFVFAASEGNDVVADFALGQDRLRFQGTDALSDLAFASVSGGVRVSFGGTSALVEGVTLGQMQDSDNFLF